jgi:transposase
MVLHRTRHLLVRHQTSTINAVRAHLAKFGIVAPIGLRIQFEALRDQIDILDRALSAWHRSNETCQRLDAMPGVGPALATALVASVTDPRAVRSGRDFSAWIGLVPKQNSSGGKERLGSITKAGDRYLRSLFCAGAHGLGHHGQGRDLSRASGTGAVGGAAKWLGDEQRERAGYGVTERLEAADST